MRRSGLFIKYAVPVVILVSAGLILGNLVEFYFSYQDSKGGPGPPAAREGDRGGGADRAVRARARAPVGLDRPDALGPHGVPLEQRRLDSLRLLRDAPAVTEVSHLDPSGPRAAPRLASGHGRRRQPHRLLRRSQVQRSRRSQDLLQPRLLPQGVGALHDDCARRQRAKTQASLPRRRISNSSGTWCPASRSAKAATPTLSTTRGRLIAHPDISLVLQKTDLAAVPQVRGVIAGTAAGADQPVEALIGRDLRGHEVLSAHAAIPALGWLVYVDVPIEEAFAPLYSAVVRTAVLLVVGLAVTIVASLVLVRRMIKPIRALQVGAARIGAGALDHRIEVRTNDELRGAGRRVQSNDRAAAGIVRRPRAQGGRAHPGSDRSAGAADGDQRNPARDQQLADRSAAGAGCRRQERRHALCREGRRNLSHRGRFSAAGRDIRSIGRSARCRSNEHR